MDPTSFSTSTGNGNQPSEYPAIGLDFGTSNTSMAISKKSKVYILRNNRDEILTPSIVAFKGDRILIGEEAKASNIKAQNVFFGMKRLLGRTSEELKKKNYGDLSFDISYDQRKPTVLVDGKRFHFEQLVAILFAKLKTNVNNSNNTIRAVLTVPSAFGSSQRYALSNAALIAGISVLERIDETTAAAIAFAYRKKVEKSRNILIFQLGGGFIDVAIFCITGHLIELRASVASDDIGGVDFTQQIVDAVFKLSAFEKTTKTPKTLAQMREASEKIKQDLSLGKETKLKLDADQVKYSRKDFEKENKKSFNIIEKMMKFVLSIAHLSYYEIDKTMVSGRSDTKMVHQTESFQSGRNAIDNYFVIGRSSMMPSVARILKKYVGEDKKKDIVNAGDAAVTGAAIYAEILSDQLDSDLKILNNVTMRKIIVADGVVSSDYDQVSSPTKLESSDMFRYLKRLASKDSNFSMEFVIRSQKPPKPDTPSGNLDSQLAGDHSKEELSKMVEDVKLCLNADKNWLAMDRRMIKISGDVHAIQDEIEELKRQATSNDFKKKLQTLQQNCDSLDDRISNAEKVSSQDLKEYQEDLEKKRKRLNELLEGQGSNGQVKKRPHSPTVHAGIKGNIEPITKQPKSPIFYGSHAIGIDLGTTNSCVAAWVNGKEEVFTDDKGSPITPSCVAFTKTEMGLLIGDTAKRRMDKDPENIIHSIKRIIGRKFYDPKTQQDVKKWLFKVESSLKGPPQTVKNRARPQIKIGHRQETYNPEEISGLVLDHMRRIAFKRLGEDVRDAVVTVPAYFNHMQRFATRTAAELAGLNVLAIINEPTAAAIGFVLKNQHISPAYKKFNILVYDFGGGTFDVTILSICKNKFDVKATSGNTRLGGDDLTNRLVDYFVEDIKTNKNTDISLNKKAKAKLWIACENAKKELSSIFETTLYVENIVDGITLSEKISRAKFERLSKKLLDNTIDYVKDAIKESGIEKEAIDLVVAVGGSCRIPYIKERLTKSFDSKIIKVPKKPDEAIAKGAAAYASYLKGNAFQQIQIELSEITPLSLGILLNNKNTSVIIKRNAKIATAKEKMHCNAKENQKNASIKICQGEEEKFEDNELLGKFVLDISPKPRHEAEISVKFCLNQDGTLRAEATDVQTNKAKCTTIRLHETLEKLDTEELI